MFHSSLFSFPDLSWIRSKLTHGDFQCPKKLECKVWFSQAAIRHHRSTIFHDGHKETVLEMMRMVASKFPRHLEVGGGCSKLWEELLPHIIDCAPSDHHHHHPIMIREWKWQFFPFLSLDFLLSSWYSIPWRVCQWIWCCRSWWWWKCRWSGIHTWCMAIIWVSRARALQREESIRGRTGATRRCLSPLSTQITPSKYFLLS